MNNYVLYDVICQLRDRAYSYSAVQWHCAKRAEAHFCAEAPEIIP